MQKLRLNIGSLRKKKKGKDGEESPPGSGSSSNVNPKWLEDEEKVRDGSCNFQVRYLGCIEVYESRGMQVCEEAVEALRWSRKKHKRALLYVSGDALRVVDELSKGLIVDQTIEKVSFCAPNRNHEKGFAYICRDGATRRWMCHAFIAHKESGERLSHAVGCAFALCLERKQKREKEAVQAVYSEDRNTFTRMGSFRQASLTERLQDPQSAILPPPQPPPSSPSSQAAIPRPRASATLVERQGSLRLFPKLQTTAQSPFKRNLSLRVNELPSTLERMNISDSENFEVIAVGDEQKSDHQYSSTAPAAPLSPLREEADIRPSIGSQSLNPFLSSPGDEASNSINPFPALHPTNPFLSCDSSLAWTQPSNPWPPIPANDAFDTSWTDLPLDESSVPQTSPRPQPRMINEEAPSEISVNNTNPFL